MDDHVSAIGQLRAAYNRCINGIESTPLQEDERRRCLAACKRLYAIYMNDDRQLMQRVEGEAVRAALVRDVSELSRISKELNLHNRNLSRLMCLFSQDLSDYHASDSTTINTDVKPGTHIECEVFLKKVELLVSQIQGAESTSAVRVPQYELSWLMPEN